MELFLDRINKAIWGTPLIITLLVIGTFYTFKLRIIQIRFPFILLHKKSESLPIKTICMSLGASMGTGNIIGTASALAIGGPGSLLWMWISAFIGMALVYAENTLAQRYNTNDIKGTMSYLLYGLNSRLLAGSFAIFCVLASLGMGGMVQVNTFTSALYNCIGEQKSITMVAIFIIIFFINKGGANRIGSTAQFILPIATISYMFLCIPVIIINIQHIPSLISEIFIQGLGFKQVSGGILGLTISVGIRRGIFSNEAGIGSSPILHSSSNSFKLNQASLCMIEVLIDSLCCTLTAITILCSGNSFTISDSLSVILGNNVYPFLTIIYGLFALCTIIGWYYCGETAFLFITKRKSSKLFCLFFSFIVALGAILENNTVWILSDIFNGLMAFPNLIGLALLNKEVKKE